MEIDKSNPYVYFGNKDSFININFSVQENVVIREEIMKTSREVTMIGMCRIK